MTLIIGENNIGKSNLLDAIGLIFSQEVSFFKRRTLSTSDFHEEAIRKLKLDIMDSKKEAKDILYPEIKIEAILTDWDANQGAIVADWFCSLGPDGKFSEAKLTYLFSPIHNFEKEKEIKVQRAFLEAAKAEIGEEEFNKLPENDRLNLINFPISKYHYSIYGGNDTSSVANTYHLNQLKFELLDALRDATRELTASSNNRLLFRILNAREENDYQNLKTQLVGLQKSIDNNVTLQEIKRGISDQLNKVSLDSDGRQNLVDFLFSLPNVEDILKKLTLIYGSGQTLIEQNGLGRNNLLFISLMLSFLEDKSNASRVYFRVVGIEEPESHLHVNLQNHLAQNLESLMVKDDKPRKDLQVLITSHSTNITTKIDFSNTVVLYGKNNQTRAHYILNGFDPKDVKTVNYLKKYFDAINTNMFYSRHIIMVEGISEQLLIPTFYKLHYKKTIESNSTALLNVNGLAFRNFLELIRKGYFIKCLVITDSDKGTKTENRADELIKDYKEVPVIMVSKTEESTFEKDLIKSNLDEKGADCLKSVIKKVRPNSGKKYLEELGDSPIDIEKYFTLIKDYKSAFAFELMTYLEESKCPDFQIPSYILEGFNFLNAE